jgi:hypothetical protein
VGFGSDSEIEKVSIGGISGSIVPRDVEEHHGSAHVIDREADAVWPKELNELGFPAGVPEFRDLFFGGREVEAAVERCA